MKQPTKLKPGQVWGRIRADKNDLEYVDTRTILWAGRKVVIYTPRKVVRRCYLPQWWRWSKTAKLVRRVKVTCFNCRGKGFVSDGSTLLGCAVCHGKGFFKP